MSEGEAGQVVRAVDFTDFLLVKELAAGGSARAGLFGRLEEQEYVPSHGFALKVQRSTAQNGGIAIVTAQVGSAAIGRGKSIIVAAQGNGGLGGFGFTVSGVETVSAIMQLQRSVFS